MSGAPPPAAPPTDTREPFEQIPWDCYEAPCPSCHAMVEWTDRADLQARIARSTYGGLVLLVRKVAIGTLNGVEQEVFCVVCPNPPCKTVFFHWKHLFNAREIQDAMERRRMRPATDIPEPVFYFHEGTAREFADEIRREPNPLIRDRVARRLRESGIVLPVG
jgi:hypothetical protein